jgi:hypothetical protein
VIRIIIAMFAVYCLLQSAGLDLELMENNKPYSIGFGLILTKEKQE